jgi:hypothetical protein
MQTFLPYPSFYASAKVLDMKRLGKQRVECKQIINALEDPAKGWQHHPATTMWRGYLPALALYGKCMCREWLDRGYKDSLLPFFQERITKAPAYIPPWIGDETFHLSHRSNLLRKMPEHYRQFWPDEPDDLPYVWPSKS